MISLNQKETFLLQDQQTHEQLCIKKYNEYANQAQDPQLKQLFQFCAQQEQQHLDTINQLLSGNMPNMANQQQNTQNPTDQTAAGQQNAQSQSTNSSQVDKDLCQDMLATEKYVSSAYDTSIFEFRDTNVRETLNHIQKEEQQHGEKIYNYMSSNGMY